MTRSRETCTRPRPRRRSARPRWLRIVLPLAAVAVIAFLYYQPLTSYVETKQQLEMRRAQVVKLREQRAELELRLEQSRNLEVLAREARRVGYIRPGEQLYIIKGIAAWRRTPGK